MHSDITGLWPAILHPLAEDGSPDVARTVAHTQTMLQAGCRGVTLFGTTGEGPAFTVAERNAMLDAVLAEGVQPHQLVVTITAVALGDAIALGRHALARGVQRQMLMPPFYFKQPRDTGIVQAISTVVDGIGSDALRLVLYHFPAMSTAGFSHAAIAELLRRYPVQMAGIKDSMGDLDHTLGLVEAFPDLSVLVGAEPQVAPAMLAGAAGSICGLANVAPRLMQRVVAAPGLVSAQDMHLMARLLALLSVKPGMPFVAAYKAMMAEQSGYAGWLRVCAPLGPLEPAEETAVRHGYRDLGTLLQAA
jgi:4-hydroxy-tetrahydrodipicolinate synthase